MTVLRRMREHLGACREVDEGCDVGDVDERSPHDLGERCTSTPHALSVSLSPPLPPPFSLSATKTVRNDILSPGSGA